MMDYADVVDLMEREGISALRADCRAAYDAWRTSDLPSRDSLPWVWWSYGDRFAELYSAGLYPHPLASTPREASF